MVQEMKRKRKGEREDQNSFREKKPGVSHANAMPELEKSQACLESPPPIATHDG